MRYWITICILVLIMLYEFHRYRYVLTSTVLWPVMWIFALFSLTQQDYFIVSWLTLSVIIAGYLLFCFSFHLNCSPFDVRTEAVSINYDIENKMGSLDILFWFTIIVTGIYLFLMRGQFSIFNFVASFTRLYRADINISSGLKYISYIPKCTLWYFAAVLGSTVGNNDKKIYNKSLTIKLISLAVLNLIIMIPGFVRTDFLFTYLPVFISIAILSGLKNKSIIVIFTIAIAGFILLFVSFSMLKHSYRYVETNIFSSALDELYEYLGGSIVAFDRLRELGGIKWFTFDGMGRHTFNGLLGLIDRVFGTNYSVETIQDFIVISNRATRTNVYTIFKWTGMDFGIIYSVLLQTLYGTIHGRLFRGIRQRNFLSVYWYSAIIYGVLMMFFSDQYFSVGALWIVTFIASTIVKYVANTNIRFKISNKKMI